MHRRDFLRPRTFLTPAIDLIGAVEGLRETLNERAEERGVLLRFARRAMATTFEVILPLGTPLAKEFAQAALDEIDAQESRLTVYRDDSVLSRLNAKAATEAVAVDEGLFQLLAQCQWLWRETRGAFDVAMGALIRCWGFFARQPRLPSHAEIAEARRRAGLGHVTLDARIGAVRFGVPGLEINLGSIGKGHALDCVGGLFRREARLGNVLIQGGKSSVLALGTEPGARRGWTIGITDPECPTRRLGLLRLRNRGVGTSAATYLHLEHQGRKLGHILDPRTGWPAEGMIGATVTAPTAAHADALATAFFILGVDAARDFCLAHPSYGVVLYSRESYPRPIVLGRAADEFLPLS